MQVLVFLRWLRHIVVHVVWDRQHIIVNMDETQLASVRHQGFGMTSGRKRKRIDARGVPRVPVDRHHKGDLHCRFFGFIGTSTASATGGTSTVHATCTSPSWSATLLRRPLSSVRILPWNRGATTPGIVSCWLTRLGSVISSFNDLAWIILVLDCDTKHLSVSTRGHRQNCSIKRI